MTTVNKDGSSIPATKRVYYNAGVVEEHPKPGYAVCYDVAAAVPTDSDEEKWKLRGNAVAQPASANLLFFAGVVKSVSATKGADGYSCWIEIIEPKPHGWTKAYCKSNATLGTTALICVDGTWSLATDASPYDSGGTVAMAGETADTSAVAANKLIMFL